MKRSGPIPRKTPMRRGPWRPTATTRQLRRQNRRDPPELGVAKVFVRDRAGGHCEAHTPVCTGAHHHTHHILPRSAGGGHNPANLLAVCRACHEYIHNHPAESYKNGWLRKRTTT